MIQNDNGSLPEFVVKARPLYALRGIDFSSTSRLLDLLDSDQYSAVTLLESGPRY